MSVLQWYFGYLISTANLLFWEVVLSSSLVEQGFIRVMIFLTLFLVVFTLKLLENYLALSKLVFHNNNMAVVNVINKLSSKSDRVINIVRRQALKCLNYVISICEHPNQTKFYSKLHKSFTVGQMQATGTNSGTISNSRAS